MLRKSLPNTGPMLPGFEMCERSEQAHSPLLICLPEASPARTSRQPEREQGLTENEAACGQNSTVSFANFDPVTSSWRTPQICFDGEWAEFSEIWPEQGMMRNGACCR